MFSHYLRRKQILYLAFFVSGISAIIYEILWIRVLSLAFGAVTIIIASVASLFLLGLCLGSFIGGRFTDIVSKHKLNYLFILYFLIEISVGLFAYVNFNLFSSFSLAAGQYRYFVVLICILIHSFLLGATWPMMFKMILSMGEDWNVAGKITFINTFGGFIGAASSNFFLIANIGLEKTLFLAISLNLLASFMVLSSYSRNYFFSNNLINVKQLKEKRVFLDGKFWIFGLMFFTGFVGMGLEILWMRTFGLIFGNSIYSFSILLAVILLSLSLGGLIIGFMKSSKVSINGLINIIVLGVISILIGMILIGRFPEILLSLKINLIESFISYSLLQFVFVGVIVVIPAMLSGMVFPYGVRMLKIYNNIPGTISGFSYFINTLGSVFGGLISAMFILPFLGIKNGLIFLTGLFFFLPVIWFISKKRNKDIFFLTLIIFVLGLIAFKTWDERKLASGVYYYGGRAMNEGGWNMIYYKDGRESTVSGTRYRGENALRINGKVDASSKGDRETQLMLGHVPVLLSRNPKNVLVIGLGSGTTAGAVNKHDDVTNLTVVEIEPEVAKVAEKYFFEVNNLVLSDPETKLVINDARNFLLKTKDKYDVITSEPSNPWIAGEGSLFTKEFFEIGKSKLDNNGIFFQWLHLYNIGQSEVKSVLATFKSVFPHTLILIGVEPNDIFLAGSNEKIDIDWNRFITFKSDNFNIGSDIMSLFCNTEISSEMVTNSEINIDNKPTLEYRSPFNLRKNTLPSNFSFILKFCQEPKRLLDNLEVPQEYRESLILTLKARKKLLEAEIEYEKGNIDNAIYLLEEAIKDDKNTPHVKERTAELYVEKADELISSMGFINNSVAERYLIDSIYFAPNYYNGSISLMYLYINQGRLKEAEELIKESEKKFPWSGAVLMYKGIITGLNGDSSKEEKLLLEAYSLEGWNTVIINNLANFYLSKGDEEKAIEMLEKSVIIDSDQQIVLKWLRELKN